MAIHYGPFIYDLSFDAKDYRNSEQNVPGPEESSSVMIFISQDSTKSNTENELQRRYYYKINDAAF